MAAATRLRKAEARIKQLCCLGLGSETVIPALLRELHELIPSHSNGFYWASANGQISNAYNEIHEAQSVARLYIQEAYNTGERAVTRSLGEAIQCEHGVVRDRQTLKVSEHDFYRSDFYNLLLRPLGYGRLLRLVVRDSAQNCGVLQLQRKLKGAGFHRPGHPTAGQPRILSCPRPGAARRVPGPAAGRQWRKRFDHRRS